MDTIHGDAADLEKTLQQLQKQLNKKQQFEESVSTIKSLLQKLYSSASPSIQNLFYTVICRTATVLKTRYTSPGFWNAGLALFIEAEQLISGTAEKKHLLSCIAQAREHLGEVENRSEDVVPAQTRTNRGFLFEGHLTVDPEPPQPDWLVQSNLLTAAATLFSGESSDGQAGRTPEEATDMVRRLVERLDEIVPMILDDGPVAPRAPPASKELVAKLPVTIVTEEILLKLGKDAGCAICTENLVLNDKMQELPCKHVFHPACSKPWLDEHNSCPVCRFELQTDDHAYESWKEREKEAEEDRKGAANAIRGGEYMYV
ncbi:OLC1v1030308C1 [Oldenlandia corymbosa var. corymbosa]|uniref:RING-type E3 ubiquitin transferase n=1 Tax=Oldenlandia corymbosa var. corymbosa TaxID=529605 RepID=A0AAV1CHB9_OLDCO|nr:OLC1v1030308C1 [Oldenlandia corymbosa var. corymbosa]